MDETQLIFIIQETGGYNTTRELMIYDFLNLSTSSVMQEQTKAQEPEEVTEVARIRLKRRS
jgi:hypothetical protein